VVVLDIAMPVMHGIQAAENLAESSPEVKILILSSYSEPQEVTRALEAGVAGFVMKETASSEIAQAVRTVHKGNAYFTPQISKRLAQQTRETFHRGGDASVSTVRLTERELQVLKLISEGQANKQIADALQISIKTVEKHRGSLMQKLDIHEAATLTKFAVACGLVPSKRPVIGEVP
jgi:DNA-binding NarL/FixJ family response regulator